MCIYAWSTLQIILVYNLNILNKSKNICNFFLNIYIYIYTNIYTCVYIYISNKNIKTYEYIDTFYMYF